MEQPAGSPILISPIEGKNTHTNHFTSTFSPLTM